MTIDSAYHIELYAEDDEVTYPFSFEVINLADCMGVYKVTTLGTRVLIPTTDYTLIFNAYTQPMSDGGVIVLDAPLADGETLSVQRNTPITNEQVFPDKQPFNAEAYEFQVDKITMILQEIEGHICDCRDSHSRRCLYFCPTCYYDWLVPKINSGTIGSMWWFDNATANPALDSSIFGVGFPKVLTTSNQLGVVDDSHNSTRVGISGGYDFGISPSSFHATLVGGCGVVARSISGTAKIIDYQWAIPGEINRTQIQVTIINGTQIEFKLIESISTIVALANITLPNGGLTNTKHHYDMRWSMAQGDAESNIEMWIDGILVYQFTDALTIGVWDNSHTHRLLMGTSGTGNVDIQYGYTTDVYFTPLDYAAQHQAFLKNMVEYQDTDATCVPLPVVPGAILSQTPFNATGTGTFIAAVGPDLTNTGGALVGGGEYGNCAEILSTDYVSIPTGLAALVDINLFTVEISHFKNDANPATKTLLWMLGDSSATSQLYMACTGTALYAACYISSVLQWSLTAPISGTASVWQKYCLEVNGPIVTLYRNGTKIAQVLNEEPVWNGTNIVVMGNRVVQGDNAYGGRGRYDEFRLTNGQALYLGRDYIPTGLPFP